tara:strand:- start:17 stop:1522 length:1506 start_codon:yes stop_codon:yes gene_type:complete
MALTYLKRLFFGQPDPGAPYYNGPLRDTEHKDPSGKYDYDYRLDPELQQGNPNFLPDKYKEAIEGDEGAERKRVLEAQQANQAPVAPTTAPPTGGTTTPGSPPPVEPGVTAVRNHVTKNTVVPRIFDIVSSNNCGKWTLSDIKKFPNEYEEIPRVILTEYKVNSSSIIQTMRVAATALIDTVGAEASRTGLVDKLLSVFPLAASMKSDLEKSLNDMTLAEQHPELAGEAEAGPLKGNRYRYLYSVFATGYSYILPYFSDTYFYIQNDWSDSSKTTSPLAKLLTPGLDKSFEAMNAPSFWDPGIYIERPKFYNFAYGNEVEVLVNFPLINTDNYDDVSCNLQLIKNLVIQNLPYRKSITRNVVPVIYDVKIPGVSHHPFCYIKKLEIKHVGNKRITHEFNGGHKTLIPDAYMISITLISMVSNASNFYLEAFGDDINGIDVTTHQSSPTPAVPAAAPAQAPAAAPPSAAPAEPTPSTTSPSQVVMRTRGGGVTRVVRVGIDA